MSQSGGSPISLLDLLRGRTSPTPTPMQRSPETALASVPSSKDYAVPQVAQRDLQAVRDYWREMAQRVVENPDEPSTIDPDLLKRSIPAGTGFWDRLAHGDLTDEDHLRALPFVGGEITPEIRDQLVRSFIKAALPRAPEGTTLESAAPPATPTWLGASQPPATPPSALALGPQATGTPSPPPPPSLGPSYNPPVAAGSPGSAQPWWAALAQGAAAGPQQAPPSGGMNFWTGGTATQAPSGVSPAATPRSTPPQPPGNYNFWQPRTTPTPTPTPTSTPTPASSGPASTGGPAVSGETDWSPPRPPQPLLRAVPETDARDVETGRWIYKDPTTGQVRIFAQRDPQTLRLLPAGDYLTSPAWQQVWKNTKDAFTDAENNWIELASSNPIARAMLQPAKELEAQRENELESARLARVADGSMSVTDAVAQRKKEQEDAALASAKAQAEAYRVSALASQAATAASQAAVLRTQQEIEQAKAQGPTLLAIQQAQLDALKLQNDERERVMARKEATNQFAQSVYPAMIRALAPTIDEPPPMYHTLVQRAGMSPDDPAAQAALTVLQKNLGLLQPVGAQGAGE